MSTLSLRAPCSGYDQTKGLAYFPRMLDKARLLASDQLREDFRANVGIKLDARMCDYLRVPYDKVRDLAVAGKSNDEILEWCFEHGRRLNESDIFIWTSFISKFGWRDDATARLETVKGENGLADRAEIQTFFQFFDVDEGRVR